MVEDGRRWWKVVRWKVMEDGRRWWKMVRGVSIQFNSIPDGGCGMEGREGGRVRGVERKEWNRLWWCQ